MPKLIYAPVCQPQADRYLKRLTHQERHQQELLRYRIRLDAALATV